MNANKIKNMTTIFSKKLIPIILIDKRFSMRKKEPIPSNLSGFDTSKNIKGYPLTIDELDIIGIPIPLPGIKSVSIDNNRLTIKSFHLPIYISPRIIRL